jgi:hypothetical protein
MSTEHVDRHIQALRDALIAEHEDRINEEQRAADQAIDDWYRQWHQDHASALRAMHYPWDRTTDAA